VTDAFAPANPLEVMMVEAQAGRMEMGVLMTALLSSPVYLVPGEGSDGGELALVAREGRDGGLYIPAFTDRGRLERFSGSNRSASVPLRDLAPSWPVEVSLVIDPGDPIELVLPGHDFRRIAGGDEPGGEETVPAGTSVMIGDPAEEPEAVLRAVAVACERRPEVIAAYRAQLHVDRAGERPHLAVGLVVEAPSEDHGELRSEVARSATAAGAEQVSVVVLDRLAEGDAVAAYMLERTQPFYSRASKG
jgi:SseB protein C-terminal domain/SseB protein N-terminal domain